MKHRTNGRVAGMARKCGKKPLLRLDDLPTKAQIVALQRREATRRRALAPTSDRVQIAGAREEAA